MPDRQLELEKELEVYRDRLHEWESIEGKFVLICSSEIVDFYDDYTDAVRAGYEKFGIAPFLVKKVAQQRQVHKITRFCAPQAAR